MSQNPAHPDAHPTAPGGMSRAALIKELIDEHGYEKGTKALWDGVKWPRLIDMVIEERKARETHDIFGVPHPVENDESRYESTEADHAIALSDDEDGEYRTPVVRSQVTMFDDLGPDPMLDEDAAHDIEDIMAELDDAPVAVVEEVLHDAGVDSDWIDPEQMFAEMTAARDEATPPPMFIGLPVVKDYIFDGHAGAGPSAAERWMNCTMSLSASRKFLETLSPNQQVVYAGANTAARQGTTAHAAAEVEANMVLGRVTEDEVTQTLLELTVMPDEEAEAYDDEMAEYITEYVDLIKSYAQERGDDHVLIESRVEAVIPLTDLHEGEMYVIRGSGDLIVLPAKSGRPEDKTLVVGDLKYGNGLDVDVEENPQIRLYALGALDLMSDDEGNLPVNVDDIVYHIVQPRLGGIKTWTESVDDLLAWRDEVAAPALTLALYGEDEGATFNPSDLACQWCPARGSCPALTAQRVEAASGLFDAVTEAEIMDGVGATPDATLLDDAELGSLLSQVAGLVDLHKDLRAEAQRRLHRGTQIPGYQLVSYTPPRSWDEGALDVINEMADEEKAVLFKPKSLVTPTQAEKLLGDTYATIESLVVKPDKRPVIAKMGDRRKTWTGTPPEQMFADESETQA